MDFYLAHLWHTVGDILMIDSLHYSILDAVVFIVN